MAVQYSKIPQNNMNEKRRSSENSWHPALTLFITLSTLLLLMTYFAVSYRERAAQYNALLQSLQHVSQNVNKMNVMDAAPLQKTEELGLLQKKLDTVLEEITSQSKRIQNLESQKVNAEYFEHLEVEASESHVSLNTKNLIDQRDNEINALKNDIMKLKSQLSDITSDKKKQAVLFRAHSSSPDMMQRMMTYSRQVHHRVDFWIQFNWHKGDESKGYMFEYNKRCAQNGCRVFYYTDKCIQAMYPKLHFETEDLKVKLGDAPKGLHTEAINLWYQLYNWYEFVWIFESDVGWSGDFNTFLDIFKNEKSDFYSQMALMKGSWPNKWKATKVYLEYTNAEIEPSKDKPRYVMAEHIVGASKRLLDMCHKISSDGGTAWSETFLPSVCMTQPGYVCVDLKEYEPTGGMKLFGEKYRFNWRLEKEEWDQIMRNETAKNQLWHALKF